MTASPSRSATSTRREQAILAGPPQQQGDKELWIVVTVWGVRSGGKQAAKARLPFRRIDPLACDRVARYIRQRTYRNSRRTDAMSALAMILTAAMVVPGDGPEKVSGEIKKGERLDLRGKWKLEFGAGTLETLTREELIRALRIQDMGEGRLRMALPKSYKGDLVFIPYTGTYRQERDRVVIQFRMVVEKTPTAFRDHYRRGYIILHRIKSDK
jgi:hypothetical protein